MTSTDLAYRSARDLAEDIRSGALSPVELMDATLERIEEREPSLNAIVYRGFDEARESAKAAEAAVSGGDPIGPLHGVPVLMKDLFDFKPGWPATFGGIPAMADYTLDIYCVWAERMEAAGAIIVGKGNSPALGYRGACDNYLFGPTANPFDTTKNSGGSSGGSAAAVADGLVPLAEGTDGGGSIRIPAAWCGVVGYQPSAGRVPSLLRPNAFAGVSPFVYEGPITRDVADAALAMEALAGPHPGDPFCALDKPDLASSLNLGVEGWKVAYSPDLGVFPVQAEVAAVVEEAVRAFEDAGADVVEVDIEIGLDQRELSDLWCRLIMPLSLDAFSNLKAGGIDILGEHRSDLPPEFLHWADHVAGMTAMEYFDDNSRRTLVFDALQSVMADHRVLVSPTLACMPAENLTNGETRGPTTIEGVEVDPVIGWCMTYFTNFTGYPAVSLPAGLSNGLPVGLQVIGGRGADLDVLAAAAAFERARPWAHIYEIPAARPIPEPRAAGTARRTPGP
jgi:amidase/aspartyl-tRNA(Asn)/glutamyl-tRNA(Gln) amidotransferase subunit A